MSKFKSFEDINDILIPDVGQEEGNESGHNEFSSVDIEKKSTTRNFSEIGDILIDPTEFLSNNTDNNNININNKGIEDDGDDDNNTYGDEYEDEDEFEEYLEEEDVSENDQQRDSQSQSLQKESPITKPKSPIGYPTIGKKGTYDDGDNDNGSYNNNDEDEESIASLDDDESVISNTIPPVYSNVKKAVKAAEDLAIEDSQDSQGGHYDNGNYNFKNTYILKEEEKEDVKASENIRNLPASIIPDIENNDNIMINKDIERGTYEHPSYSRSIKKPPLHSRKVPSQPSGSSSSSSSNNSYINAFVHSQIPPSTQKGRRVVAEMRAMARGTVRQGSDIKPIHARDVPGITSYLKSKEEEENIQDNSNINQSNSYNDSYTLDETTISNDTAHNELRAALKQAGFSGVNINPNQLVHVLAAMMDKAGQKVNEDQDFRSKLNRRSKPVPTYASEAYLGLRENTRIDRIDVDEANPVTKLHKKGNKIRSKKNEGSIGGVFGNMSEEGLSQATYRGIPPYDDDYDAAIESEDIALSAVLQGAVGVESEALEAYASMHNRIAALEAKLRDPEGETQRVLANVKESREPAMQQYVNTRAQEISLMASRSLENLPKPPASLKMDNNNNNNNFSNPSVNVATSKANGLLRIGSDRLDLMVKAQELYANFLSDMCDLCKNRTSSATSVEELAMHRAIAEHVRKNFSGFGNIEKIQQEMVAAAIEVSLLS